MKKLFVVLTALFIGVSASAQVGVIAGVTSTTTDINAAREQLKAGDITLYHVGLTTKIDLGAIALQPSLIYNVKGTQLSEVKGTEGVDLANYSADFKTGFLELPVQLQVGLNLGGFRPYVFAEPFVGFAITNEFTKKFEAVGAAEVVEESDASNQWENIGSDVKDRLEYGVGAGVGIDLLNSLQISVRYYWNMGQLYNGEANKFQGSTAGEVANGFLDTMKNQQCTGIMASVAFFF